MVASKALAEFIGTFFLVATIGLAVLGGAGAMAPVAIGAALITMVCACGHVSGAHFNPAVTLAVFLRGKIDATGALVYVVTQIAASLAAAYVACWLVGGPAPAAASPDAAKAFVAEFLFTFALSFVVLNVATAKGTSGNSFYGVAIGLAVVAGAYAVGPISGGAFNPAVSAGLVVLGLAKISTLWMFLGGQLLGAAAAALAFKVATRDDA